MKKLVIIIGALMALIVWSDPAAAIDKSKKEKPPQADKKVEIKKDKKDTGRKDRVAGSHKTKKSYDDFVDRNNNGIDDRAEKATPKEKKAPKPPSQKPSKP